MAPMKRTASRMSVAWVLSTAGRANAFERTENVMEKMTAATGMMRHSASRKNANPTHFSAVTDVA